MERPYIICHMMTSLDGRIDCQMTEKLKGVEDYYNTLDKLDTPTTLSGRITAELELALPGFYIPKNKEILNHEAFSKKVDSKSYEIITDTKGKLLWPNATGMEKPYLIITSENVSKDYLNYLDNQNISWIACGKEKINLKKAVEILYKEFNVKRLAIVGGAIINGAFLDAKLLDEISILIGAGIDGRKGFSPVFDGLAKKHEITNLTLQDVKRFASDAIWLRYKVNY